MIYLIVLGLQAEVGKQERGPSDSIQRAGHLSARERPVPTDGQPASRETPRTQEEVPGDHCKITMNGFIRQ